METLATTPTTNEQTLGNFVLRATHPVGGESEPNEDLVASCGD